MSDRLDPKDFGLKLYNRFPPSYRADDVGQKYALKRYIEAAADGGFKYVIEEQNGILDLVNPQTSPLEAVYALYEQYGLELFHGIPEEFLRSFLPNIGLAWSKKGSLDVVEFIVSSLSGIKTSTEVTYDEHDNPLVTVRLEMDFSVSDYFPNAKQFERILSKFIPFYCDALLVYSYVYYENASVHGDDFTTTDIHEKVVEEGRIPYGVHIGLEPMLNTDKRLNFNFILNESKYFGIQENSLLNTSRSLSKDFTLNLSDILTGEYDTDYCEDIITHLVTETGKVANTGNTSGRTPEPMLNVETCLLNCNFILNSVMNTEKSFDHIKYAPVEEKSNVGGSDEVKDKVLQTYIESGNLQSSEQDVCEENIAFSVSQDVGSVDNSTEAFTNTLYSRLNESFCLTPVTCVDRITVVGVLNENFVLNSGYYNETTEIVTTLF